MNQPGEPPAAGAADLGAFLARLLRFDPAGLARLRPVTPGVVAVWARLPFDVLVTRLVRSELTADATVRASELLAVLERGELHRGEAALPARHDLAWRSALPPSDGVPLEQVPSGELRRIADAAAATLKAATGTGVGERRLRDELLDHVALIVTHGDARHEIPVRLVQGVVRMGFLGPDDRTAVQIRHVTGWLGAEARYGTAWLRRPGGFSLTPTPPR
ncbi:MAG: hypothetical protein ACRDUA_08900 [Micromonosporaceae bacterium]